MPAQALVKDKKYEGKYVALESFTNHRVVASGDSPAKVISSAGKQGVADPVVVFIPKSGMVHIY